MSDYTPSTDEVTAAWVAASATHKPEHITRLIESVRDEERERIARNIEAQIDPYGSDFSDWNTAVRRAARIARRDRIAREGA